MDLSQMDESTHLCVFCLRNIFSFVNSNDLKDNLLKFKAFTKMLDRFVGCSNIKSGNLVGQLDLDCLLLGCCQDCLVLINSFCEVYHQFKCLELVLEWKIWKLVQIMKLANKVPSRVSQLHNILDRSKVAKAVRLEIIKKCNKKLAKCQPRVLLQNNKSPLKTFVNVSEDTFPKVSNDTESNGNESFADFEPENNHDDYDYAEVGEHFNPIQENSGIVENTCDDNSLEEPQSIPAALPSQITKNILPVCKSEPQNEVENIIQSTNNKIKSEICENITCSEIASTTTKQRYKLREKRKQNYIQENDNQEHLPKYNSTPISSSETSSDDSDSGDIAVAVTKKRKRSTSTPLKSNLENHSSQLMTCNKDKCNKRFTNETIYKNHLRLHFHGQFSCQFCSIVKTNLIHLSNHEFKIHSKNKKITKRKSANGFICPRCPFKTCYSSDYQAHFAHTHFSIGIPPPNRQEILKCEICSRKMSERLKNYHYKSWHKVTAQNTKISCKKEGCSAYFLLDWQLQSHCKKEHEPQKPKKSTFQCHICLKKFPTRLQLSRHKRLIHKISFRQNVLNAPSTQLTDVTSLRNIIEYTAHHGRRQISFDRKNPECLCMRACKGIRIDCRYCATYVRLSVVCTRYK